MRAEWVTSIRDQCIEAGVPFFFKQWGGVRKGTTGRDLDGRTHDDVPHHPRDRVVPSRAERARRGATIDQLVASRPIPERALLRAV